MGLLTISNGHMSRVSYISELPTRQDPMKANRKTCSPPARNGPKGREDVRVPYRRDHLQISPHNLSAAMGTFEHGLLTPKGVTRHPPLQHGRNHATRCRGLVCGRQPACSPRPVFGVAAPCCSTDSKHDDRPLCALPVAPCKWALAIACAPYRGDRIRRKRIWSRPRNRPRSIAVHQDGNCVDLLP